MENIPKNNHAIQNQTPIDDGDSCGSVFDWGYRCLDIGVLGEQNRRVDEESSFLKLLNLIISKMYEEREYGSLYYMIELARGLFPQANAARMIYRLIDRPVIRRLNAKEELTVEAMRSLAKSFNKLRDCNGGFLTAALSIAKGDRKWDGRGTALPEDKVAVFLLQSTSSRLGHIVMQQIACRNNMEQVVAFHKPIVNHAHKGGETLYIVLWTLQ